MDKALTFKHLFGPVPSRRFGRSLGVDLTPFKTCSLDCVFCQLGRTTLKTMERKEYVPVNEVVEEMDKWMRHHPGEASYITLAGSGEPTLHSRFGEIIEFAREYPKTPVALLTNGTTLHLPEVRLAASRADVVKITLSAWDQKSFKSIHRPQSNLKFKQVLEGEQLLREEFQGDIWMEVVILKGINSERDDVLRIAEIARSIRPDRIHLNTCVRPPAEDFASPVSHELLSELAGLFEPCAEVITEFRPDSSSTFTDNETAILDILRRRPCTAQEMAKLFGMHLNEVAKHLGRLTRTSAVQVRSGKHDKYYFVQNAKGNKNG